MLYARIIRAIMFAAIISGCAGTETPRPATTDSTSPAVPVVSAPVELPSHMGTPRVSSYAPEDLIRHGKEFDPALPADGISVTTDSVRFEPAWTPGGGAEGLAFCCYSFTVPGYAEEPEVLLDWIDPPPDYSMICIGLADWGANRWRWFADNPSGPVSLPSMGPYINGDGRLAMVLAAAGTQACQLRWVCLGRMPETVPQLDISARDGVVPLMVNFSAFNSEAGAGEIIAHEWDFDGDGEYDLQTGSDSFTNHEYQTPGDYFPAVRLTTDYGVRATVSREVTAVPTWAHSFGQTGYEQLVGVAAEGDAVYAMGHTQSYGDGNSAVMLLKYGIDGTFQWARAWSGPGHDSGTDVLSDGSDGVFTFGRTNSFGTGRDNLLIQHWSAEGEPLWTTVWEHAEETYWTEAVLADDEIYVIGTSGSPLTEGIILKCSTTGTVLWAKDFGTAFIDNGKAIRAVHPSGEELQIHTASRYDETGNSGILYCRFNASGALQDAMRWTTTTDDLWTTTIYVVRNPAAVYFAGYTGGPTDMEDVFLVSLVDGVATVNRTWNAGPDITSRCTDLVKIDNALVLGSTFGGKATLMTTGMNGTLLAAITYVGDDGNVNCWDLHPVYERGILLAGNAGNGAAGEWNTASLNAGTTAGYWAPQSVNISDATGTSYSPGGTLTVITDGVHDTGGGDTDGFTALAPVP